MCVVLSGCGGAAGGVRTDDGRLSPTRLYPMAARSVWTFDVDDGAGHRVFHFLRVEEAAGDVRRIAVPNGESQTYELRTDGIYDVQHESWLLRAPIEVGAQWSARSGRTARVLRVDQELETSAGRFSGCVVVNERGDESPQEIRTTYCSDVGPVVIQTKLPMGLSGRVLTVEARLRAYQLGS